METTIWTDLFPLPFHSSSFPLSRMRSPCEPAQLSVLQQCTYGEDPVSITINGFGAPIYLWCHSVLGDSMHDLMPRGILDIPAIIPSPFLSHSSALNLHSTTLSYCRMFLLSWTFLPHVRPFSSYLALTTVSHPWLHTAGDRNKFVTNNPH